MDVLEVLGVTVEVLRGIMIPVELAEQVGKPVLGAIGNLRLCIEAIEKNLSASAEASPLSGETTPLSPAERGTSPQQAGATMEEGAEA